LLHALDAVQVILGAGAHLAVRRTTAGVDVGFNVVVGRLTEGHLIGATQLHLLMKLPTQLVLKSQRHLLAACAGGLANALALIHKLGPVDFATFENGHG